MKTITALPFYFCLFVMMLLLCSCGLFHKVQTTQHSKVDSTAASHFDSTVKKGIDTTKNSTVFVSNGDSVSVELAIDTTVRGIRVYKDGKWSWLNSPEYHVSYDHTTHTVTANSPIKRAVFKTDSEVAYSNFTGGIDTTLIQVAKSDTAHKVADIQIKNKEITRKGAPLFTKIIIVVVFVLVLAFWILFFIARKKKETIKTAVKDIIENL